MLKKVNIEYPAYIYKKNGIFVANCVIYNLCAIGESVEEVLENLRKLMNNTIKDCDISIKPVFKKDINSK